ncbi:hypothetical protein PTR34_23935 [Serratia nevei]|uniref:hypothetical protein n=1 Tax=Serratia nevei TaxID=2703794 RepID=UPI00313EDC3C
MDNKLSKPVAQAYYDEHDSSTMLIDWLVDSVPEAPTTLYSQEYVSALLAELEFEKQNNAGFAGMVEDYETKLEAKDKRIADMEHVVAAAKCDDELWDAMAHRLKTLEAKLATPVRLHRGALMVSAYAANSFNSEWHLCLARDSVVGSIRAAGFTVEGDEQ